MITEHFNATTQKPEDYKFDYAREVEAFYAAWPEMRDKIFLIDVRADSFSIIGQEFAADWEEHLKDQPNFKSILSTIRAGNSGITVFEGEEGPEDDLTCIFLNRDPNPNNISSLENVASLDVENAFSLDHETGHVICRNGHRALKDIHTITNDPSETVADAYAALMHLRRFGKDPTSLQYVAAARTVEFMMGISAYFSSPVIQQIVQDRDTLDLLNMSPTQIAELAADYAEKYSLSSAMMYEIKKDFIYHGELTSLGEAIAHTQTPESFRWGALGLRAIMDGLVKMPTGVKPLSDKDAQKMREKLDKREAELAGTAPKRKFFGLLGNDP